MQLECHLLFSLWLPTQELFNPASLREGTVSDHSHNNTQRHKGGWPVVHSYKRESWFQKSPEPVDIRRCWRSLCCQAVINALFRNMKKTKKQAPPENIHLRPLVLWLHLSSQNEIWTKTVLCIWRLQKNLRLVQICLCIHVCCWMHPALVTGGGRK